MQLTNEIQAAHFRAAIMRDDPELRRPGAQREVAVVVGKSRTRCSKISHTVESGRPSNQ